MLILYLQPSIYNSITHVAERFQNLHFESLSHIFIEADKLTLII